MFNKRDIYIERALEEHNNLFDNISHYMVPEVVGRDGNVTRLEDHER